MFFFKDDVLFVRAHSLDNGGSFIYSLNRPEFSIDAVPAIASAAIDCSLGFEVCDWGIDLVSVGKMLQSDDSGAIVSVTVGEGSGWGSLKVCEADFEGLLMVLSARSWGRPRLVFIVHIVLWQLSEIKVLQKIIDFKDQHAVLKLDVKIDQRVQKQGGNKTYITWKLPRLPRPKGLQTSLLLLLPLQSHHDSLFWKGLPNLEWAWKSRLLSHLPQNPSRNQPQQARGQTIGTWKTRGAVSIGEEIMENEPSYPQLQTKCVGSRGNRGQIEARVLYPQNIQREKQRGLRFRVHKGWLRTNHHQDIPFQQWRLLETYPQSEKIGHGRFEGENREDVWNRQRF